MPRFARIAVAVAVFLTVVAFSNILLSIMLPEAWFLPVSLFGYALAFIAARFTWKRLGSLQHNGLLASIALGACVLGGIGFIAGFIGPMVFAPGANQGPLLGIFITGPGGFALGGIGGAAWWFYRRRG